jgi:broad specificity phosphatase PhoE
MPSPIHVIRHGETEWSLLGRHTSHSDIPLTERGEAEARRLAPLLGKTQFTHVLVSPMQRAKETANLAGFAAAKVEERLREWNYGDYEGLLSSEIKKLEPNWNIFEDGCPNGENPQQVSDRADSLIADLKRLEGDVALFAHGHFLRVLGARWARFPVSAGRGLLLSTASISILGYEHDDANEPALSEWNHTEA